MYNIEEFDKQKTKVLKYIIYKKRTKQEIINKFSNTINNDLLEDIIEQLKENGYINDDIYIQRAVNEYINLKTLSIKEIKYKLYSKGIDNEKIEEYIEKNKENLDKYELKSAQKIVMKKKAELEKAEIIRFLLKKGYKKDIINQAMEEI